MNNELVNQVIQGIGVMTELWMITYNGFKSQGLTDDDAIGHTKAFMSIMMASMTGTNSQEENK